MDGIESEDEAVDAQMIPSDEESCTGRRLSQYEGCVSRGRTILRLELFFDMDLQVTFQSKRELLQRTETQVVEIQALSEGPPLLRESVSFYNSVGPSP